MEIKDLDYNIQYDEATKTVKFTGSIRLQNLPAYEPIKLFLSRRCQTLPRNFAHYGLQGFTICKQFGDHYPLYVHY